MLQFFQERKASNIDGYFKLLNPHSGKFLTVVDSVTTKIVDEQNFDQLPLFDNMEEDNNNQTEQPEQPERPEQPQQPQQPEQLEETEMELDISVERDDQLWKFDPNTFTLTSKKGPWRYETKMWNIFPGEGATGILRDSSSLLLTISVDGLVGLDVPWDLIPADGPDVQIWVG